jgi:hypothetical protein
MFLALQKEIDLLFNKNRLRLIDLAQLCLTQTTLAKPNGQASEARRSDTQRIRKAPPHTSVYEPRQNGTKAFQCMAIARKLQPTAMRTPARPIRSKRLV